MKIDDNIIKKADTESVKSVRRAGWGEVYIICGKGKCLAWSEIERVVEAERVTIMRMTKWTNWHKWKEVKVKETESYKEAIIFIKGDF